MTEAFYNFYTDQLASPVGTGDTVISVNDATPLQSPPGHFRLQIDGELLLATSVSGNNITVTRGVEGTIAATHALGALVINIVTAGALYQLRTDAQGGSGITQLTHDVVAGPGSGSLAATVVGIQNNPVSNVAPTAGQVLIENSGATGSVWKSITGAATLNAAGVLTLLLGAGASVTGELPVTNIAPGTDNYVLTTVAGVAAWTAAIGLNQLHGDVVAGPGAGNLAATVVAIQNNLVNNTPPTAGQILVENSAANGSAWKSISGAGTLAATGILTINLAAGSTITNLLPVTNIAPGGTAQEVLTTVGGVSTWQTPITSGITQLTGDVTAGPGANSQAAVVVAIQGNAVSNTPPTAAQFLVENSGATGSVWVSLSGAGTLSSAGLLTVNLAAGSPITGLLPLTNITPSGTNNWVLTTVGGVVTWSVAAVSGITQLTGDVTAGPGSGSEVASVVAIQGNPVSNVSPTAAQFLVENSGATGSKWVSLSGAGSLSSVGVLTVNLAAGSTITGLLPLTNVTPSGTDTWVLTTSAGVVTWAAASSGGINQLTTDVLAGPGSGSQVATVTQAQGGAVTFTGGSFYLAMSATASTWQASATVNLTQAPTSGATGSNFTISSQASTNANGTPGSIVISLPAPTGSGTQPFFEISQTGATYISQWQYYGSSYNAYYQAGHVSGDDWTILSNYNTTWIGAGIDVVIGPAGAIPLTVTSTDVTVNTAHNAAFNGATDFGTGVGVIAVSNATTQPTTTPSGGIVLSADAGTLAVWDSNGNNAQVSGSGLTFSAAGTVDIIQSPTSGTSGQTLTITGQASTNANGTPGAVVVAYAAPTGSGSESYFGVVRGGTFGTPLMSVSSFPGVPSDTLLTFQALPNGSGTNWSFLGSSTDTYFNAPGSGGHIYFKMANAFVAATLQPTSGEFDVTGNLSVGVNGSLGTGSFGGGVGCIYIDNGTVPTSTPSGGVVLAGSSGSLRIYDTNGKNVIVNGSGLTFSLSATVDIIQTTTPSNLVGAMTLTAQGSSAGTTAPGGVFNFISPAPGSTGVEGYWQFTRGSTAMLTVSAFTGTPSAVCFYPQGATIGSTGYFLANQSGITILNATTENYFKVGGNLYASQIATEFDFANNVAIGTTAGGSYGGGVGVISLLNAATQPTSAPTGGIVLSADGGNFQVYDSGGNNVLMGGSGMQFSKAGQASISQAAQTTDVVTKTLTITGQTADPTAVTNFTGGSISLTPGLGSTTTNGQGGNISLNFSAPLGTGAEAYASFNRNGQLFASIGAYPTTPSYGAFWLGSTKTGSNYFAISDGTSFTQINAPTTGSTLYFSVGGQVLGNWTTGSFTLGSASSLTGSGSGALLSFANGSTQPSTAVSGGVILVANAGALALYDPVAVGSNITISSYGFVSSANATNGGIGWGQSPVTTAAATGFAMNFAAQSATGSGLTIGGALNLSSGSGNTAGAINIKPGGVTTAEFQGVNGSNPGGLTFVSNNTVSITCTGVSGTNIGTGLNISASPAGTIAAGALVLSAGGGGTAGGAVTLASGSGTTGNGNLTLTSNLGSGTPGSWLWNGPALTASLSSLSGGTALGSTLVKGFIVTVNGTAVKFLVSA